MQNPRSFGWFFLIDLLGAAWLSGCKGDRVTDVPRTPSTLEEMANSLPKTMQLPEPRLEGEITFEESLTQKRSLGEFGDTPLSSKALGQLLWSVQGITHPNGYRTAPSAGALYPLEVYVITPEALYHYYSREQRLDLHQEGDFRHCQGRNKLARFFAGKMSGGLLSEFVKKAGHAA
jgi:hypothetical protein